MVSPDETGKKPIIENILDIEWEMFRNVNGSGPKASCQLDCDKFKRMRTCQYMTWSKAHLKSWLADLRDALRLGRNLPAEKYIRMMEHTDPDGFAALGCCLPDIDAATAGMINEIVAIHLRWREELDRDFPALMGRGRKLRQADAPTPGETAFETYLRAELDTCSPKTIAIYHADILASEREGGNEARENMLNQAREAGFESLESANASLARQGQHAE